MYGGWIVEELAMIAVHPITLVLLAALLLLVYIRIVVVGASDEPDRVIRDARPAPIPGDAVALFLSPWHPSMVGHHDAVRAHLALTILADRNCHVFGPWSNCIDMCRAALFDEAPFEGMRWDAAVRSIRRDPRNWCPGCIARQGLGPTQQTKED